jgi:hypothetical protein
VAGVIVFGASAALAFSMWRSSRPPGAPANVRVTAVSCDTPCVRIDPQMTITWTGPGSGADVTGFRVFKDGSPLPGATNLDPSTTIVVDRDVDLGVASAYRVGALNGETISPLSDEIVGTPPQPPVASASLSGTYRVKITVRHARALGTVLGVENPNRGRESVDRWTFLSACAFEKAACPSRWEDLPGMLRPAGRSWRGTIQGPSARCGGGTSVPAPIEMELRSERADADEGSWVVRTFRGQVEISFRCPGFPVSVGKVQVAGTRL